MKKGLYSLLAFVAVIQGIYLISDLDHQEDSLMEENIAQEEVQSNAQSSVQSDDQPELHASNPEDEHLTKDDHLEGESYQDKHKDQHEADKSINQKEDTPSGDDDGTYEELNDEDFIIDDKRDESVETKVALEKELKFINGQIDSLTQLKKYYAAKAKRFKNRASRTKFRNSNHGDSHKYQRLSKEYESISARVEVEIEELHKMRKATLEKLSKFEK